MSTWRPARSTISAVCGDDPAGVRALPPPREVDAVVSSDLGAAFCVHEALRLGIRVPDELQIVAYDGTYLTSAAGMTITAIRQDCRAMAELVATRMSDAIRSEAGGVQWCGAGRGYRGGRVGFVADRAGDDADDVGVRAILQVMDLFDDVVPVTVVPGATTRC